MQLYLNGRHYIFNEDSAQFLEDCPERFQSATILREKNIDFSLFVSANMRKLSEEVRRKTILAIKKVLDFGIPIKFSETGLTAGQKLVKGLFERKLNVKEKDIYGVFDIDQFLLKDEDCVTAIKNLGEKMLKQKSLIALGSRDVSVFLAHNSYPNKLRIIHELIHSLIPGKKIFIAQQPIWKNNVDNFYREIGESTPGFYLVDPNNKLYDKLKNEVLSNHQLYFNLPGFTIEYFIPLWCAIYSSVTTGYVHSTKNVQWTRPSLEDELQRAKEIIRKSTNQLIETNIGPQIKNALYDKKKILTDLNKYFQKEEILKVINLMSEN